MLLRHKTTMTALFAVAMNFFLTSAGTRADEEPAPNPEALKEVERTLQAASLSPTQLGDPAFDKYVDAGLFLQAVGSVDSALLTDLALQMAEGERILMRPHKTFPASKLFEIAMKAALSAKDGASLERLEKGAALLKNEEFKEKVASARALIKGSRAIEPLLQLSDEKTIETNLQLQLYHDNIRRAKLYGDAEALKVLAKELSENKQLTGKTNTAMKSLINETLEGLPKEKDATAEALQKLTSASRGPTPNSTPFVFANGNSKGAGVIIVNGFDPSSPPHTIKPPPAYYVLTNRNPLLCGNPPGPRPGYFVCYPETSYIPYIPPNLKYTFGLTNMTKRYNVSFTLIAPNGMTASYMAQQNYKSEFPFFYKGAGAPKIRIWQFNGTSVDYMPNSTWGYFFVMSGNQIVLVTDKNQPVKPLPQK